MNHLHESGLGYRKISYYLNERGYKTQSNQSFRNTDVYSIILRNQQRKDRLLLRNKEYPLKISSLEIELLE